MIVAEFVPCFDVMGGVDSDEGDQPRTGPFFVFIVTVRIMVNQKRASDSSRSAGFSTSLSSPKHLLLTIAP